MGARFLVGGVLCIVGVALIFVPELARVTSVEATTRGALYIVAAVLLSAVGSLAASRNARHGLPFWASVGWGMVHGAALSGGVVLLRGQTLAWPSAPAWWVSLIYLALAGSVIAFACFLTLQERVGPGPASTVGVMTPVLALVLSALFEGFEPVPLTALGVCLAVAGNWLILGGGAKTPLMPAASRATR
jgi:drug/metabolite transporter (DMT)-like permease